MTKTVSQQSLVPHAKRIRVGGIVLDSNNNLLIVYGRESQKWSLPKGALDNEDETYFQGALREIYEESGLKLRPPANIKSPQRWSINKALIYLLKVPGCCPKTQPKDTNEVLKTNWLDLNNRHKVDEIKKEANKMLIAAIDRILNHLPPPQKAKQTLKITAKNNYSTSTPKASKIKPSKIKQTSPMNQHQHQQTGIPCI